MSRIPVIVCAKNEERGIALTLEALLAACRHAETRGSHRFEVRVVLDDTTDGTEAVVRRFPVVELRTSQGGKVEAQRVGVALSVDAPFVVFCDADVRPSEDALLELADLLTTRPDVYVATCPLRPLPTRRASLLAAALHTYNSRRGFSSSRTWFNGKLFAIRAWDVPGRAALAERIAALPPDAFYDFASGLVVDDIYLSRAVLLAHGPGALAETERGEVLFRAPETLRGMYRYYRRMRRELERLDRLFPETVQVHRAHGVRKQDLLARAPLREKMYHALFRAALEVCKTAYVTERAWVRHARGTPREPWPSIEETKA